MDDDFNSPQAVAVIFDFTRELNKKIAETDNLSKSFYENAKSFLDKTAVNVLGILNFDSLSADSGPSLENELIELLIKFRADAKVNKNYKLADQIRDELKNIGVILQDSKDKTTFKKINS